MLNRLVLYFGACATVAAAQSADVLKPAPHMDMMFAGAHHLADAGPFQIGMPLALAAAPVTGAPYSAQSVTERVQNLADGNRITQTISSTIARDGQGRIRRQESLPALPGDAAGSKTDAPKLDFIEDPVAGVHWMLDAQNKIAFKTPQLKRTAIAGGPVPPPPPPPPPPGPERTFFYSSGAPGAPLTIQTSIQHVIDDNANVTRVDLGTQTVEGVRAQGNRVTRVIPAGSVGNEQPIHIVTETWFSPDLKVLIMSKSEDPRMGTSTYRLTNIVRAEPSPDLFQVPAGYTVKDQPGDVIFHREIKKD